MNGDKKKKPIFDFSDLNSGNQEKTEKEPKKRRFTFDFSDMPQIKEAERIVPTEEILSQEYGPEQMKGASTFGQRFVRNLASNPIIQAGAQPAKTFIESVNLGSEREPDPLVAGVRAATGIPMALGELTALPFTIGDATMREVGLGPVADVLASPFHLAAQGVQSGEQAIDSILRSVAGDEVADLGLSPEQSQKVGRSISALNQLGAQFLVPGAAHKITKMGEAPVVERKAFEPTKKQVEISKAEPLPPEVQKGVADLPQKIEAPEALKRAGELQEAPVEIPPSFRKKMVEELGPDTMTPRGEVSRLSDKDLGEVYEQMKAEKPPVVEESAGVKEPPRPEEGGAVSKSDVVLREVPTPKEMEGLEVREIYIGGNRAGIVTFGRGGGITQIQGIEITPEFRGKGFGKEVYTQLRNEARQRGESLVSDIVTSKEAKRVWDSFVKSGEAVKVGPNSYAFEEGGAVSIIPPESYKVRNTEQAIEFGKTFDIEQARNAWDRYKKTNARALESKSTRTAFEAQLLREQVEGYISKLTGGEHKAMRGVEIEKALRQQEGSAVYSSFIPGIESLKQLKEMLVNRPERPVQNVNAQSELVKRVADIITEAKPVRGEQEKLYHQERRKRAARLGQVYESAEGEASLYRALATQKGELPKAEFENVRNRITQLELDQLHNMVIKSDLSLYEKLTAQKALDGMFTESGGSVPTRGELALLENVFGTEFVDAVSKKLSNWQQFKNISVDAANIPRTVMAAFDMSMPFRQAAIQTIRHPVQAIRWFKDMHKSFFSEKAFQDIKRDLASRDNALLYKEFKLDVLDADKEHGPLTAREEAFTSHLAERIPVIGKGVRMSSRAAYTYTNKVRADVFDMYAAELKKMGLTPENNPAHYSALAKWINISTGRGSYGSLTRYAPTASALLFSPRLLASRFQVLNPATYAKMPKEVRIMAMKDMLAFGSAVTGLLTLASTLPGADVETDPRSSDFGKLRIGKTRIDMLAGFAQIIRFGAMLTTGQRKSATTGLVTKMTGEEFTGSRLQTIYRFGESKLNPHVGLLFDWLRGKNFVGQPFELSSEAVSHLAPLYLQDAYEVMEDKDFLTGLAISIPGFYGGGVQTYGPRDDKEAFIEQTAERLKGLPPDKRASAFSKEDRVRAKELGVTGGEIRDVLRYSPTQLGFKRLSLSDAIYTYERATDEVQKELKQILAQKASGAKKISDEDKEKLAAILNLKFNRKEKADALRRMTPDQREQFRGFIIQQ